MPSLELKIPPPLVAATVAGAMVATAVWLPPVLDVPYGIRLGGALVLAGVTSVEEAVRVTRQETPEAHPLPEPALGSAA